MRRKVAIAGVVLIGLLVIAAAVLWVWKPWVPAIELLDPGENGERVVEPGLFANYYAADGEAVGAILLLHGSVGGINSSTTHTALALQEAGFNVLVPSYFGAPGQPHNLELIPLETFDRALSWLGSRPEVPRDRMAVMGSSKGAEAALLVALRHPDLRAVVAGDPSSAVWPGINWSRPRAQASWIADGEPLLTLPYGPFHVSVLFGDLGRFYEGAVERLREHSEAAIAIEQIQAPVLLVCGEADRLWPSCPMSRQLEARAEEAGTPPVRVLAYERVGHGVLGPRVPDGHPSYRWLDRWGGTAAEANAARADGWPIVLA
ncbi:MAG: alpha/beta hydrolase family protein [bacterium]